MIRRRCKICGCTFGVPPKQATRAYCNRKACQIERRNRELANERKKYRLVQKGIKKIQAREKPDQGRKCRRCGSNCFPNYFFCNECHHYVSVNGLQNNDNDDLSAA